MTKPTTTEKKIKQAADQLFTQKGYEAARVRDIAKLADVNLALVNYHFKSKENLFKLIIHEKIQRLFGNILPIITDDSVSLEDKVEMIVREYIKVLSLDHNILIFVFSELQKQEETLFDIVPVDAIRNSSIMKQAQERQPDIDPIHFILNLLGMAFFPFIVTPVVVKSGIATEDEMARIIQERVKLIPIWVKQTLN